MLFGWYNLLATYFLGDGKMQKQGLLKFTYILASLLFVLVCAAGCLEIDYGSPSSEIGSSSMIDIFSNNSKTSSKPAASSNISTSSKSASSDKTEASSKAQTSSEEINFYNSGVLGPDETSSEKEIVFYNSGVIVESETDDNSGRIAYDTPTGKKYHLDKECAGKNAIEVSYDEIKTRKEPCKTCAKDK